MRAHMLFFAGIYWNGTTQLPRLVERFGLRCDLSPESRCLAAQGAGYEVLAGFIPTRWHHWNDYAY